LVGAVRWGRDDAGRRTGTARMAASGTMSMRVTPIRRDRPNAGARLSVICSDSSDTRPSATTERGSRSIVQSCRSGSNRRATWARSGSTRTSSGLIGPISSHPGCMAVVSPTWRDGSAVRRWVFVPRGRAARPGGKPAICGSRVVDPLYRGGCFSRLPRFRGPKDWIPGLTSDCPPILVDFVRRSIAFEGQSIRGV
jgi:hypothetical protein